MIHFNKFSWKWLINSKVVGDRTVGMGWAEVGLLYNCIKFVSLRKRSEILFGVFFLKVETFGTICRFLNEGVVRNNTFWKKVIGMLNCAEYKLRI